MGGGDHGHGPEGGDFRAKVWSMSGGPYCRPKHWKRNTAIAMAGIVLVCIPIAMKSAELEFVGDALPDNWHHWACQVFPIFFAATCLDVSIRQRPHHPIRPIPSQLWCKNFGTKDY